MVSSDNFSAKELMCRCGCNTHGFTAETLEKLQELRNRLGRAMVLTSAYRCCNHPVEARKAIPGTHANGIAVDVQARTGPEKYEIVKLALEVGFTGIGIHSRFIHLDTRKGTPTVWLY